MARMVFRIDGMDCAQEVAILRTELGPLVGGEQYLSFDLLNGRMTILPGGNPVSTETIKEKVAATGMEATDIQSERTETGLYRRHNIQTAYTVLSGLSILMGVILHIVVADGLFDAPVRFDNYKAWSVNWDTLVSYLKSLLDTHAQLAMPVSEKIAYGAAVAFGGRYMVVKAWYALRRLRPDMNVLMTIAVAGAIVINEWFEAATVAFLFSSSLAIESWSVGRARRAIRALLDLAPSTVRLKNESGEEKIVPAEQVPVGAHIVVAPGERIPLDGRVTTGSSSVNQAPITGESIPVSKHAGDEVFAGTINDEGTLQIQCTRRAGDTTLARIIHLVEQAQSRRADAEQ